MTTNRLNGWAAVIGTPDPEMERIEARLVEAGVRVLHAEKAGPVAKAWRGGWCHSEGYVDAYGDPDRGFAGAYVPAKEVTP